MTITKVGIAYSKSQQIIRRITKLHIGMVDGEPNRLLPKHVVDAIDEDQEWTHHTSILHPNEGWAFIPIDTYDSFTHPQQIHDHLGLNGIAAVNDRCMVVDKNGFVIAVGCYDPFIDKHPAGMIIPHAIAEVGGTFIKGIYNKPSTLLIFSRRKLKAA